MIAHVAEAGENRGRVVVRIGAFTGASTAVLEGAVHVARAFQSEIEALFIEDPALAAIADHTLARAVSSNGSRIAIDEGRMAREVANFAVAAQREVATLARAAGVAVSGKIARDDPIEALSSACAERGPWNIVVFAEPIATADRAAVLTEAMARVWGTTAFLTAGRGARWQRGPVVAVAEDIERLSGLVRAAQRLAAISGDEVILVPAADDDIALDWLEGEIRLTLGESSGVRVLPRIETRGSPAVLRAAIACLKPRMILAKSGGLLLPHDRIDQALSDLRCPAFIIH